MAGLLFYGCQTLRQLLPTAAESASVVSGVDWPVPRLQIEDSPRFAWRGAMLDVARHFFPITELERVVDLIAYHKMNRFHVHLTDDQGWRLEIKSWPNLTTLGGATQVGGGTGGYYTQAQWSSFVAYAAERQVIVIPEIDLPGHANAALASYGTLNPDGQAKSSLGMGGSRTGNHRPAWLVSRGTILAEPACRQHFAEATAADLAQQFGGMSCPGPHPPWKSYSRTVTEAGCAPRSQTRRQNRMKRPITRYMTGVV